MCGCMSLHISIGLSIQLYPPMPHFAVLRPPIKAAPVYVVCCMLYVCRLFLDVCMSLHISIGLLTALPVTDASILRCCGHR